MTMMRSIISAAALIAGTNAFGTCDNDEEKRWPWLIDCDAFLKK
jgi:hypothetical protein